MATEKLTLEKFKNEIFDYENEQEWNYKGDLPAVIDFYADWCAPCRMVAPIMDKLSEEYAGKARFYKVDTEKEQQLAAMFGIRSIPSILFIPKEGTPKMLVGALQEADFRKVVEKELFGRDGEAAAASSEG